MANHYDVEITTGIGKCEDCGHYEWSHVQVWYKGSLLMNHRGDDHLGPQPMSLADVYKTILDEEGIFVRVEEIDYDG